MKRTKIFTAIFLGFILLILVVLVSFFSTSYQDSEPESTLSLTNNSYKDCIPSKFGTESEYRQNDLYSCIYKSLVTSLDVSTEEFASVSEFFESYGKKDGVFANICHLAAHDAGSEYAGITTPITALQVSTDFCFSGFVHGVFDFVGASKLDQSVWLEIAQECEKLSNARPMACADGLGHASWDFYKNPEDAFNSCEVFSKPEKVAECAEGVVMQTYAPAVLKPTSKVLEKPKDLKLVCKDLTNDSLAKGCFFGVGWLLANDIAIETAPYLAQRSYPIERYDSLLQVFSNGVESCLNLEKGSSDCLGRFYTSVPYPIWGDSELKEFLCSSNKLIEESCLTAAKSIAG